MSERFSVRRRALVAALAIVGSSLTALAASTATDAAISDEWCASISQPASMSFDEAGEHLVVSTGDAVSWYRSNGTVLATAQTSPFAREVVSTGTYDIVVGASDFVTVFDASSKS